MKKYIIIAFFLLISFNVSTREVQARRTHRAAGTAASFFSKNKEFQLNASNLKNLVVSSPARLALLKNGVMIWSKDFSSTPAFAYIADNGSYLILVNYRNFDEGWLGSISFLKGDGSVLKEIPIEGMDHYFSAAIARNGNFFAFGESRGKKSVVLMYDVTNPRKMWERIVGSGDPRYIEVSADGSYVLTGTRGWECKWLIVCKGSDSLDYAYLGNSGNILWHQLIKNNSDSKEKFAELSDDGLTLRILDTQDQKWLTFKNQDGKILAQ